MCKNILDRNPESDEGKQALIWLYSILRSDYRQNNLQEKDNFFGYLQNIQNKYSQSETGKLALQYMIVWEKLRKDNSAVIRLSNEALKFFKDEERKWVLIDLVMAYTQVGLLEEAKNSLQELKQSYSDEDIIEYIELNIADVEDQIANGYFKSISPLVTEISAPKEYGLFSNYPNPFNPVTVIKYSLPSDERVVIKVYDILGREVAILLNEDKSAGTYSISFDASKLASGIYFYSITAGKFNQVKKMVLAK